MRYLFLLQDELRPVYLVSTISEWLTAAAVVLFVLTFYRDFSRITLQGPRVRVSRSRLSKSTCTHLQVQR